MKPILLLLLLPLYLSGQSNAKTDSPKWHTNYEEALGLAQDYNKDLLMYFTGSDWCAPCRALKKSVLDSEEFSNLAKDYVLLYVDIPRKKDKISPEEMEQNMELLSRFNQKGIFPFMSLIQSNEKEKATISGFGSKSDKGRYLKFLQKHR